MKIARKKILNFSKGSIVSTIVKEVMRYRPKGSALDLGSGTGTNALFLAKKGFAVTVVDRDADAMAALKAAAKKKRVILRCVQKDMTDYRPQKKADLVIAINSLHFLDGKGVAKAVRNMKKFTASKGLNVIAAHTNRNPAGSRPYLFKKNELKKFYSDWKILKYGEKLGAPFLTDSGKEPVRKYKAEIIARKP